MYKTADFAASINGPSAGGRIDTAQDLRRCLKNTTHFVIADNFSGFISTENQWNGTHNCILFLKNNTERPEKFGNIFPQMEESNGYRMLHVSKEYTQLAERLYVLEGKQCISTLFVHHESCENFNFSMPDSCRIKCVDKVRFQQSIYNETICKQSVLWVKGEYIIDIESDGCFTCNNPVKLPEDNIKLDSILPNEGGKLDASEAADVMNKMADLAASINGSSAAVTLGEEASGILVRQADPKDFYEISFGYGSQKDNIYIVENQDNLSKFSRSVTLPKEAFEKTASLNVSVPFVAVLRFINLASDEKNSNLLGNEVIAVEMGTAISNLTDKITLNYKMVDYDGMLSCHSWNGVGNYNIFFISENNQSGLMTDV
ncbi:uncharacterized protein [Clinocottus analis]|uniref:uncharacterized protein n=1 Tax=Clinocottus analis TaxID=304258 RepID=UPI0035C13D79